MATKSAADSQADPPAAEESVLAHNLDEMHTSMLRLLNVESIGGNAGFVRIHGRTVPCAAARGFADARSGKMLPFGNGLKLAKAIRATHGEFILRVAVDTKLVPHFSRIVGLTGCAPFSVKARRILRRSIELWNQEHGVHPRVAAKDKPAAGK